MFADRLQHLETGFAGMVVGNNFAIQYHFMFLQREGLRDYSEFFRKINAVSGIELLVMAA